MNKNVNSEYTMTEIKRTQRVSSLRVRTAKRKIKKRSNRFFVQHIRLPAVVSAMLIIIPQYFVD